MFLRQFNAILLKNRGVISFRDLIISFDVDWDNIFSEFLNNKYARISSRLSSFVITHLRLHILFYCPVNFGLSWIREFQIVVNVSEMSKGHAKAFFTHVNLMSWRTKQNIICVPSSPFLKVTGLNVILPNFLYANVYRKVLYSDGIGNGIWLYHPCCYFC